MYYYTVLIIGEDYKEGETEIYRGQVCVTSWLEATDRARLILDYMKRVQPFIEWRSEVSETPFASDLEMEICPN